MVKLERDGTGRRGETFEDRLTRLVLRGLRLRQQRAQPAPPPVSAEPAEDEQLSEVEALREMIATLEDERDHLVQSEAQATASLAALSVYLRAVESRFVPAEWRVSGWDEGHAVATDARLLAAKRAYLTARQLQQEGI